MLTTTPASQIDFSSSVLSIYSPMKKVAKSPIIPNNTSRPRHTFSFNVETSEEFSIRNMIAVRPAPVPKMIPMHQIPYKVELLCY